MIHARRPPRTSHVRRRRGAIVVLLLVLLVVVIGMVACAVDVGRMVLLRAEVQNAVDAGALAATLQLQQNSRNLREAEDAARRFVRLNPVGTSMQVAEDLIDVEAGRFDPDSNTFQAGAADANAVRVFARTDREPFSFARVFGLSTYGSGASAIATGSPTETDIMLVLDLSGSMAREGRIQALWKAAPLFLDTIEEIGGDDKIGVMGLAADPLYYDPVKKRDNGRVYHSGLHATHDYYAGVLEAALSSDFPRLRRNAFTMANLPSGKYTGWTGTGAALGDSVHYLLHGSEARAAAAKFIVLMSDGYANKPSGNGPGYARTMAQYAAANDVIVYTISLGNEADVALMQQIADITGGEHFDATGSGVTMLSQRLSDAFRSAAKSIKRVQLVQ